MNNHFKRLETKLIHAGEPKPLIHGAVAMPIFQSATFEYAGQTSYDDLKYIRLNNTPNHLALHRKLAALENAEAALVSASGMAAISSALLTVLSTGDHLLAQDCLYGGTHDFLTRDFSTFGLSYDFIDVEDPPPARFQHFSDELWRIPLRDSRPAGPPEVIFRTGGETGPDGLAVDDRGRIYLTAARAGQLWRFDPKTGQGELLADGLPGLASIAFGQGEFDHESLYAMQIQGGRILRFHLGVRGALLYR